MKKKMLSGFQIFLLLFALMSFVAAVMAADEWIIPANTAKTVDSTTRLSKLIIEDEATLNAPAGHRLILTVNGVGTGQVLETWEGVDYKLAPGIYKGNVVLTVTKPNDVVWTGAGGEPGVARGTGGTGTGMAEGWTQAISRDLF